MKKLSVFLAALLLISLFACPAFASQTIEVPECGVTVEYKH